MSHLLVSSDTGQERLSNAAAASKLRSDSSLQAFDNRRSINFALWGALMSGHFEAMNAIGITCTKRRAASWSKASDPLRLLQIQAGIAHIWWSSAVSSPCSAGKNRAIPKSAILMVTVEANSRGSVPILQSPYVRKFPV